jgi:dTDP-glucose 4,6-dehydratase
MSKTLLVTGGLGFIGSNFVNYCLENTNYKIINVDRNDYCSSLSNVKNNHINYNFYFGDISNNDLILKLLNKYNVNIVVHFAAQSHVGNCFSNPLQYTKDNVFGTHKMLEAAKDYGKLEKFIHVSTDEVYGESQLDDVTKNTEQSLLCPTNPYAATKASAEMLVRSYYKSFNLPVIITRGNNVFGQNQYPEKVIPLFVKLLKENKKVTIQGDGSTVRGFLHVTDTVLGFIKILEEGKIGEIYNIGTEDENEITIMDLAKEIISQVKPNEPIDKWITYIKDREFNDKRYYISNQKLKDLGWDITIPFKQGLKDVVQWYLKTDLYSHWKELE